jgi:hypothetical protein
MRNPHRERYSVQLTLRYSTPYTKLYNKDPNYSMLRIFGCKCYPLLKPYISHKLEYRSKACIFFGYSHAGYRCLDPITDKVYLSRNIVFYENLFPAMDSLNSYSLPSCMQVLLLLCLCLKTLVFHCYLLGLQFLLQLPLNNT